MAILDINVIEVGQVGVAPRTVKILTTDSLATITAAGYLNSSSLQGIVIFPTDVLEIIYAYSASNPSGTLGIFQPNISAGVITLNIWENAGGAVLLPVVSGDFANFNGTTGQIKDAGYSASDPTKTKVVMANATQTINRLAVYVDNSGTIGQDATIAVNGGSFQAGTAVGVHGTFISYPTTTAKGNFIFAAANNAGATSTVLTNASMGQASTITIPDPGGATANVALAPAALVSGNLIKASGTAGLVADMGYKIIAGTTTAYAGGGTSNAFTVAGLTSSCVGSVVIRTSTTAVSIAKSVPSTNTLTITFSADPGASTTVDYVYLTASAT